MGFLARIAARVGHAAEALSDVLVKVPQIPEELTRAFAAITLSTGRAVPPDGKP
jgi:hypothetical protein